MEETLKTQMLARPRKLMWVNLKGHNGTDGNEEADGREKQEVEMGWRMYSPDIATPVGIKQAHPMHPKAPAHMRWSTRAMKGLVYMGRLTNPRPLSLVLESPKPLF